MMHRSSSGRSGMGGSHNHHDGLFQGQNVFLSPKLAHEKAKELEELLMRHGASTSACRDPPDVAGENDFFITESLGGEECSDLHSRKYQVIGVECVHHCIRDRKPLPKSNRPVCCLCMEGVGVLVSGHNAVEKGRIESMVESMSGATHKRIVESVCYVIAKDVRSERYKWAIDLKKPTISVEWVEQCWSEHRLVAHEEFRLPPFKGLIISATGVPTERRKEIEAQTRANGGTYSADLTRMCTHLIANSATGTKYKVAKRWKTIKVVNFQWFAQSLAAKGCLDEDKFPVGPGHGSPLAGAERGKSSSQRTLLNPLGTIVRETPSAVQNLFGVVRDGGGIGGVSGEGKDNGMSSGGGQRKRKRLAADGEDRRGEQGERKEDAVLASDTYGDDDGLDMADDMYLSAFRVHLVGFNKEDMMKWVNMVRDGGGTRYIAFNDVVTHVVVGQPVESEWKPIRLRALSGSLTIVWPSWLTECTRKGMAVNIREEHLVPVKFLTGSALPVWQGRREDARGGQSSTRLTRRNGMAAANYLSEDSGSGAGRSAMSSIEQGEVYAEGKENVERPQKLARHAEGTGVHGGAFVQRGRETDVCVLVDGSQGGRWGTRGGGNGRGDKKTVMDDSRGGGVDGRAQNVLSRQGSTGPDNTSVPGAPVRPDPGKVGASLGTSRQTDSIVGRVAEKTADEPGPSLPALDFLFADMVFFIKKMEQNESDIVVDWITRSGGKLVDKGEDLSRLKDVTVVMGHAGSAAEKAIDGSHAVTRHWVQSCLMHNSLRDPDSHILYRPLRCSVPLPGFENTLFCISQYDDEERQYAKFLVKALGGRFSEVLKKRTTHLLCRVAGGEKYRAAREWNVTVVTLDWVIACVNQDSVIDTDAYHPPEPSAADRDPFLTQCPTQAARLAAGIEMPSQLENPTQSRQFSKSDISLPEESNQERAVSSVRRTSAASVLQPNIRANHPSGDGQSGEAQGEEGAAVGRSVPDLARDVRAEQHTTTGDDGPAKGTRGGRGAGKGSLSYLTTNRKPPASGSPGKRARKSPSTTRGAGRQNPAAHSSGAQPDDTRGKKRAAEADAQEEEDAQRPDTSAARKQVKTGNEERNNRAVGGVVGGEAIGAQYAGGCEIAEDSESPSDVAAAIEGLLAQTVKVKGSQQSVSMTGGERDLLNAQNAPASQTSPPPAGRSTQTDFKRPQANKSWPPRSRNPRRSTRRDKEAAEKEKVEKRIEMTDSEKFQESQLDSQTIAYDDEQVGREQMMERARRLTRNSVIEQAMGPGAGRGNGGNLPKRSASLRDFGRLFRAAEANK